MKLKWKWMAKDTFEPGTEVTIIDSTECEMRNCKHADCSKIKYRIEHDPRYGVWRCGWALQPMEGSLDYILFVK